MDPLSTVAVALAVALAIGWYLSYTAVRLDRLHTRLEATGAALDAQLVRRAEGVIDIAYSGRLDQASAALVLEAGRHCMDVEGAWGAPRCAAETALTELLRVAMPDPPSDAEEAVMRVRLARSFHNEAVDQTRAVRQQWAVRTFHLAGRTDLPEPVIFDDQWPPPT